jgi:hypothetical protein
MVVAAAKTDESVNERKQKNGSVRCLILRSSLGKKKVGH